MDSKLLVEEHSAQIADLQARVSFQEDAIAALDEVVAKQDQELIAMNSHIKNLVEKLKDLHFSIDNTATPDQERPPHY